MKISVITVAFNNEDTIEKTILSVLEQKSKNFLLEYIVVDGGSTDSTMQTIANYRKNISHLIHEPDNGIYDALNKGIKAATGDIIGFMHADDLFTSNDVLKKIALRFENTQCDAVYSDLLYVDRLHATKIFRKWKAGSFAPSKLKYGWMPPHPTFYAKTEVYKKWGFFNTRFHIAADYDMLLRILSDNSLKIEYIPEYLVKMRTGGQSNRSIRNLIRKSMEDLQSVKQNNVGGVFTVLMKNLRKMTQLI